MAKIALIDDSMMVRSKIKKDFQQGGHEVVEATDGLSGLELLRNNPDILLLICDVNMPNLDGVSMLERAKDEIGKIPITLIMTTEMDEKLKERGKAVGVRSWLIKPVGSDILQKVLDQALKEAE